MSIYLLFFGENNNAVDGSTMSTLGKMMFLFCLLMFLFDGVDTKDWHGKVPSTARGDTQ